MALRFLCEKHREWLNRDPEQAVNSPINACNTGWSLYHQERWNEALFYTGNAYEAAEIMLIHQVAVPDGPLHWYLNMLVGLTQTLKKMGRLADCRDVYKSAIERLRKESMRLGTPNSNVERQIDRLRKELAEVEVTSRLVAQSQAGTSASLATVTVH